MSVQAVYLQVFGHAELFLSISSNQTQAMTRKAHIYAIFGHFLSHIGV